MYQCSFPPTSWIRLILDGVIFPPSLSTSYENSMYRNSWFTCEPVSGMAWVRWISLATHIPMLYLIYQSWTPGICGWDYFACLIIFKVLLLQFGNYFFLHKLIKQHVIVLQKKLILAFGAIPPRHFDPASVVELSLSLD